MSHLFSLAMVKFSLVDQEYDVHQLPMQVASFTGEREAITSYSKYLVDAYKSGVHEGSATGVGLGLVMCVVFGSYALAVWFGSKMIRKNGYTGGEALDVIVAVLIGSM